MLTLPPTPTIQPPQAPAITKAQPTREVRTNRADEQESPSFESALHQAGESIEQSESVESIPEDSAASSDEQPELDAPGSEAPAPDTENEADTEFTVETPIENDETQINAAAVVAGAVPGSAIEPVTDQATAPADTPETTAKGANTPTLKPVTAAQQVVTPEAPQQPELLLAETLPVNVQTESSTETSPQPAPQVESQTAAAESQAATVNVPAPTAPQPVEGATVQAASIDAPVEVGSDTGSGADTSQGDARQGAAQQGSSARILENTAAPQVPIEVPEAQQVRQPVADAAPIVAEPVAVEPQPASTGLSTDGVRPSAAPTAPQAPSLGTVEPDQAFTTAVQRGLAAAVRQQGGTLTIKLDPPTLGKLTIKMTIDQGKVEASFAANNAQARDLLIEHASTLRAQLRDKGLSVEKIEIVGATAAQNARATQSSSGEQPGSHSEHDETQQDAAGGQSRGRSETGEEQSSRNDGINGESARSADDPATSRFETQLRYSVNAVA